MLTYSLTPGDGIGWAIDEDARLLRRALRGKARELVAPLGQIIHSPFWVGLEHYSPRVLARRMVLAQADNPPFFYLTQPEFAMAQVLVHRWVARSQEAMDQFQALELPSTLVPYAIDETIFRPLSEGGDIRAGLGLKPGDYVVGNFHRDSEGADLTRPKFQKAPEIFVWVLEELKARGVPVVALLAGPRRHFILGQLRGKGIPHVFAGKMPGTEDDLAINILSRDRLAQLYAACDVYLIASRWEGGPQSVMEAAACRCPVVSSRVGVALDLLPGSCLFNDPREAVEMLARDYRERHLKKEVQETFERCLAAHSSRAMGEKIGSLYEELEAALTGKEFGSRFSLFDLVENFAWQLPRRIPRNFGKPVLLHKPGICREWDARMACVQAACNNLRQGGVIVGNAGGEAISADVQIAGPQLSSFVQGAVVIAGSVQEALNFRQRGCKNPLVVFPFAAADQLSGTGALVIAHADTSAGPLVEAALEAGRAVVYPEDSAYRWQAFYDGSAYGPSRPLEEARKAANDPKRPRSIRPQAHLPDFLSRLLKTARRIRGLVACKR